jgi:hypothetical protein
MYNIIKHAHSGIMWIVVTLVAISVIMSLLKVLLNEKDTKTGFFKFLKIIKHIVYLQAILGIILLFVSPLVHYSSGMMKNADLRFHAIEHPLMMLIAVGFIAMGLFIQKKKSTVKQKNTIIFIFNFIALAIMLYMIPWSAVLG